VQLTVQCMHSMLRKCIMMLKRGQFGFHFLLSCFLLVSKSWGMFPSKEIGGF